MVLMQASLPDTLVNGAVYFKDFPAQSRRDSLHTLPDEFHWRHQILAIPHIIVVIISWRYNMHTDLMSA